MQGLFVNAFLPDYKNESKDIHLWGKDNLLPQKLITLVADSGIATGSAKKVAEYIASDGFVNKDLSKLKVNRDQTADKLLQAQAGYMSILNGVAFHIKRKGGLLKDIEATAIPAQCVRKQITGGGYVYNETLGQPKFDKNKDTVYAKFESRDIPAIELANPKYANGEILFTYLETPYSQHYPVPVYYAQIEDVQTSSEISKMDLELAVNGFMPSSIITIVGDLDNKNKQASGLTEVEEYQEDFKQWTGQRKNSDGLAGRFKAMLAFAPTKDEIPNLQQLDLKSTLEGTNSKRDILGRSVCRLFGVHPVLIGYEDAAALGNSQSLSNASAELNRVVNPMQRIITEAFAALFPGYDWTISEYMPINYIPDALLTDMTQDERRNKLLGLPPIKTDATGEGDKIVKALNSLSPLVANKVLESLTPDEIRNLIGLGAKVEPTPKANG